MGATFNPLQLLLAALVVLGTWTAYSSDYWALPTPMPPEHVRLANTWGVPGR